MSENEAKDKELAIFEEIRKDLALSSELKVPMSYVFGRGTVKAIQSFGNTSLLVNSTKVDKAIQNVEELQSIWNHSHSQWSWKHLNLSYHAPYKNMRQIAAEMAKKKAALNEAKWRHVEVEIKIRKIEEELQKEGLDYWREVELKVKLTKLKEGLAEGMSYVEGAMKDVLTLNALYEELKEKVSGFTEHDIEKEETKSHLKRSIVQCIRDVRQFGSISKGEQEYVEQIGVNPMKLQAVLRAYVENEAKQQTWDVSGLYEFVDKLVDELADVYKVDVARMKLQGFSSEPIEEFSYSNKVALLEKKEEE
jgi:hypothetical protein